MTKNKLKKTVIIVVTVIIAVLLIYRIVLMLLASNALMLGDKFKAVDYYSTVDECITASLEDNLASTGSAVPSFPTDGHDRAKTLFSYENDKQYAELFISSDEYHMWFFVLNKENMDNETRYSVADYKNSVELQRDEWIEIGDFRYMTVTDLDNQTYNGTEPKVTDVKIKTVNGQEQLYLLFVDTTKE